MAFCGLRPSRTFVAHSAIWVLLPVGNMAFCHSAGNLFAGARTFSAAKVIKPVTESILPLSERGSWAPPLEERGAGVSFSFRPLGVWRFAVEPGIYSSAKEAGGLLFRRLKSRLQPRRRLSLRDIRGAFGIF
jgi:hypothetical protein